MRISDMMTRNVVTVSPETLVVEAEKTMKENGVRRLPVMQGDKLVGIVTKYDLLEAAPSPATSLSVYELNYLLAKMKVKEIMRKDVVVLSPDTPFEDALKLGQEKKIGAFPVVDNGKLVGIATESDIVRFLSRVLGLDEEGLRVTIEGLGREPGSLEKAISIATQPERMILSMMLVSRPEQHDWMLVLHVRTADPDALVDDLRGAGFKVTRAVASVTKEL